LLDAMVQHGLPLSSQNSVGSDEVDNPCSFNKKLGKCKKSAKNKHREFSEPILRWVLSDEVERDEGADAEKISAKFAAAGREMPGGNSIIPGGYGSFVRGLVKGPIANDLLHNGLRDEDLDVRLGAAVALIEWDKQTVRKEDTKLSTEFTSSTSTRQSPASTFREGPPSSTSTEVDKIRGVQITTDAGMVYSARRAVVTLPLGVLQAGSVSFSPSLPEVKERAIRRLQCGAMAKVYLSFPRCFWASTATGWGICGTSGDQPESLFERALFFPYFRGRSDGGPKSASVMCILLYGKAAIAIESKSDAEVASAAVAALSRAVACPGSKAHFPAIGGKARFVPEPTSVSISRWMSDPYSRCAWTAFGIGSSPADCEALARPIGDDRRISFAGEHTTVDEMGTVHGAWLTGLREAEQVLMACMIDGRFEPGPGCATAASWMLYCRDGLARAQALHDCADESSSDESE